MMGIRVSQILKLGLPVLMALGACAQQTTAKSSTTSPASTNTGTSTIRQCTTVVDVANEAAIQSFFDKLVRKLEGKPTACLSIDNTSSSPDVSFRFEYEDDYGIRYYNAHKEDLFNLHLDLDAKKIEVIFMDEVGFVQINGTLDNDSGIYTATIKYYNFPSQEDWINQQVAAAVAACKAAEDRAKAKKDPIPGQPTVASCLGYQSWTSAYWWDNPTQSSTEQQTLLDQAHTALASSQTKTLGTVKFDLADVLTQ